MIKLISFVFQLAWQQLCSRGVSVRTPGPAEYTRLCWARTVLLCAESPIRALWFWEVRWIWKLHGNFLISPLRSFNISPHPSVSLFVLSLISQWKQMIYVQSSLWSLCVIPIRSVGPRARLRTLWVFIETVDCLLEDTKHYSVGMQSPTSSQSIPYLQHSHMSDEYYPLKKGPLDHSLLITVCKRYAQIKSPGDK